MSTHLDHKEVKRPDAFIESGRTVFTVFQKNAKILGALSVVAAITVAAAYFYQDKQSEKALEGASKLYTAKKSLTAVISKITKDDKEWESKVKVELDKFEAVAATLSGAPAFEAWTDLAATYYDRAVYEKSLVYFEKALKVAPSTVFDLATRYQMVFAQENLKKHDDAIANLQKVIAAKNPAFIGEATVALARNLEAKGDKAKALSELEKFKKEYPEMAAARSIEPMMERLKK